MIQENIIAIRQELPPEVKLVAVSKFHPVEAIREAYAAGQRAFGENRPQEFAKKVEELKDLSDLEFHFIGHLQTNKLKLVLPYAHLVQSVDSQHLLDAIQDWGKANGKVISVLLELHIGAEQTKTGFKEEEILDIVNQMTNDAQQTSVNQHHDTDFSFQTKSGYRHRVNVYFQKGKPAIAIRLLRNDIPTLEDLGLPPILADFAMRPRGLVLVTAA